MKWNSRCSKTSIVRPPLGWNKSFLMLWDDLNIWLKYLQNCENRSKNNDGYNEFVLMLKWSYHFSSNMEEYLENWSKYKVDCYCKLFLILRWSQQGFTVHGQGHWSLFYRKVMVTSAAYNALYIFLVTLRWGQRWYLTN